MWESRKGLRRYVSVHVWIILTKISLNMYLTFDLCDVREQETVKTLYLCKCWDDSHQIKFEASYGNVAEFSKYLSLYGIQ